MKLARIPSTDFFEVIKYAKPRDTNEIARHGRPMMPGDDNGSVFSGMSGSRELNRFPTKERQLIPLSSNGECLARYQTDILRYGQVPVICT